MTTWQELDPRQEDIVLIGPMLEQEWQMQTFFKALPQIAVDGGIWHAQEPLLWAGDGDSGFVPDKVPVFVKDDQRVTDFAFCLAGVSGWAWKRLHAVGFTGGRRDHDLANIGEVHALMKKRRQFESATFYDDKAMPVLRLYNAGRHEVDINGRFGLLCIEPATVTLAGACEYAASSLKLDPLSGRGVSNQGRGIVEVTADAPCIIAQG